MRIDRISLFDPGMEEHIWYPNTWETEAGEASLICPSSSRPLRDPNSKTSRERENNNHLLTAHMPGNCIIISFHLLRCLRSRVLSPF